jgi:hypothetical protein
MSTPMKSRADIGAATADYWHFICCEAGDVPQAPFKISAVRGLEEYEHTLVTDETVSSAHQALLQFIAFINGTSPGPVTGLDVSRLTAISNYAMASPLAFALIQVVREIHQDLTISETWIPNTASAITNGGAAFLKVGRLESNHDHGKCFPHEPFPFPDIFPHYGNTGQHPSIEFICENHDEHIWEATLHERQGDCPLHGSSGVQECPGCVEARLVRGNSADSD